MTYQALRAVRQHVDALRVALLAPDPSGLDACLPALEQSISSLLQVEAGLRTGFTDPRLRSELTALGRELYVVTKLLENGEALQRDLARLLATFTAGYLPTGEPAPLAQPVAAPGGISIRG